jgi:hypothetical protein
MRKSFPIFVLLLSLFTACQRAKTDNSIKDNIHEKGWNTTFRAADEAKYQLNYPLAVIEFQKILNTALDAEGKIYAQNQLILCHLSMNEDSIASFLLHQTMPLKDTAQWSKNNRADFCYNKGVIDYRNDAAEAPIWLEEALTLYQKNCTS